MKWHEMGADESTDVTESSVKNFADQCQGNTQLNTQPRTDKQAEPVSNSASLVTLAAQILAVIITVAVVSMIASMLVTESLSGDAEQINRAGALRMQALRISRAHLAQAASLSDNANDSADDSAKDSATGDNRDDNSDQPLRVNHEIAAFEQQFAHLFSGGLNSMKNNEAIATQFQQLSVLWQQLKRPGPVPTIAAFDHFVLAINQLVTLLQQESEKKLNLLRLIQGISLFAMLTVALVVLIKLNRAIIMPLKQLVKVAEDAGRGTFNTQVVYEADNELGVLARTINHMSTELKSTYQQFESRVEQKTRALTRSNRSLEMLYRASRNLTNFGYNPMEQQLINELEQLLGFGRVSIELLPLTGNQLHIVVMPAENSNDYFCFNRMQYPLEKHDQRFGYLIWQFPRHEQAEEWQTQILQTMTDIIATAITLEKKRNIDNRLLIVEERAVIARELHDSLAQSLSYLKVQMSLLTRKMQKDLPKEQVNETIEDIKSGLNNAYQQLRELLTTFRLKLDDPSLENALHGTVTEFVAKCHHPIDLECKIPLNYLSANQEIHVLQIIREALSNVQRHAKASHAGIIVLKNNDHVSVEIWDNGIGLTQNLSKQGHFGLGIMEERAKSLHASIDLQPVLPHGTRVTLAFKP